MPKSALVLVIVVATVCAVALTVACATTHPVLVGATNGVVGVTDILCFACLAHPMPRGVS